MTADDIRTRLDAIEAYCAAATEGPWWTNGLPYCLDGEADVTFTVNARTDLPAVVAALRDALAEVERLHDLIPQQVHPYRVERDALAAENARLRAQVQAVEALCPPGLTAHRIVYAFELRAALATEAGESPAVIDAAHLTHQREWSAETFGPGTRLLGVLDHIRKELAEIEADPTDLGEWIDVVILAFDGAWRAGWEPQQIIDAIKAKQARNEARTWPDWRTADTDKAIEHVRTTGAES